MILKEIINIMKRKIKSANVYINTFFKWLIIAGITGCVGGVIGALFSYSVQYANIWFSEQSWLLFILPFGGLIIVALYKANKMDNDPGTNCVIDAIRTKKNVPIIMSPLIFVSTFITHLLGGSAGREGAALQLGGSLGSTVSRLLRLDAKDMHLAVLCGMSGVFSALFCTPITAAFFALEVISVGVTYYAALVPCFISSITAYFISTFMGITPLRFDLTKYIPQVNIISIMQVVGLSAACALVSIVFCVTMHYMPKLLKKYLKNDFLRVFVGGIVIILLTLAVGSHDYNGTGSGVIVSAINGTANYEAFFFKILFTAITIGSGYKGGEIVPTLFIGSTFGCVLGGLLGMNPSFGAAIGLIALFCGVINCPIASIILSVEMFGSQGFILFAIASAISYMLSGYYGLYSSQKILYSKLKAEFININAK